MVEIGIYEQINSKPWRPYNASRNPKKCQQEPTKYVPQRPFGNDCLQNVIESFGK